jgi:hypothetical protein
VGPYRNHYVPRTAAGWVSVVAFLGLMALAQPPIAFWAERSFAEMSVFGLPVFYVYLGGVYFSLIGVLLWTLWKRV